jgi:hypothetical protein
MQFILQMTHYNEKVLIKDDDMITSPSRFPITVIYQRQFLYIILGLGPKKGEYLIFTTHLVQDEAC